MSSTQKIINNWKQFFLPQKYELIYVIQYLQSILNSMNPSVFFDGSTIGYEFLSSNSQPLTRFANPNERTVSIGYSHC